MTRLIVPFHLKPEVSSEAYERWARFKDLAAGAALSLVGQCGDAASAPAMRRIAAAFGKIADPAFMVTERAAS